MRRLCALTLLLALACNEQDDAEKLRKSVTSWTATLQIVADARLDNEVRDGFALKTIDAAVEDLQKQPRDERADHLIRAAAGLRQAIERDDRGAIARSRGELAR